jgi:hypothetical protein
MPRAEHLDFRAAKNKAACARRDLRIPNAPAMPIIRHEP